MDNTFDDEEKLYRAVYPPSHPGLFWKKDGRISPSAFADPKGLSVERGYYRKSEEITRKHLFLRAMSLSSKNPAECCESQVHTGIALREETGRMDV